MTASPGPLNLALDVWIPVRRQSGAVEWIAPWQVTDGIDDDPFVGIAAPRPDFAGALTEFCIGLVTTAAAPENDAAWRKLGKAPPSPKALRDRFEKIAFAFELDGAGPCFLQDFDPDFAGEERPVATLLIDAPGENALRRNTDVFVKRGGAPALSRAAAAMALYTLQTYAPSGGQGHRTSLRGGGPLTTLAVLGERLWDRIWPNVETRQQIENRKIEPRADDWAEIFPWLAPTRLSDKSGRATTPADAHPLQVYWGMPRRIRLIFSEADGEPCALTGRRDGLVVRSYRTKNFGVNYGEGWEHPLTPHYRQKTGNALLPQHGQPGGISYRDWLGLVISDSGSSGMPAACVRHVLDQPRLSAARGWRLAVFGYDMDNMKARGWIDSEMPLHDLEDPAKRERVRALADALVHAAEIVAFVLTGAVKSALYDNPKDVPGDLGFIGERFWRETETAFFAALRRLSDQSDDEPDEEDPAAPLRRDWLRLLDRTAARLFDELAPSEGLEHGAMKRLVRARFGLVLTLRGEGKQGAKLFQHLDLMTPAERRRRAAALEKAS